jgi:excisionase family DNA binding protein
MAGLFSTLERRKPNPMLTSTRSAYLTKDELAQILGVSESLVRQWTRDGTIPPHFYARGDGNAYSYSPIAVVLGEVMLELGQLFGQNSALPKQVIRQLVPQIELAWHEPERPARLTVFHDTLEVRAPLSFLTRAKEKLAAVPA